MNSPDGLPEDVPLSVVIGAPGGGSEVIHCLEALYPLAQSGGAEIILAVSPGVGDSSNAATQERIHRQFPAVHVLQFSQPYTIHQLRGLGIARSRGGIIAMIDAFSIVDKEWIPRIIQAHRERSNLVIGGLVEPYAASSKNLASWTIYFHEYGRFMAPQHGGETDILAASNISYKREALFDPSSHPRFQVFWKEFVNQGIMGAGQALWLDPNVVVRSRKPISFREFFSSRYDNGRCFAGMRAEHFTFGKRLFYAGATPLLPGLLLWRCARSFWDKRRFRGQFVLTLPLQCVFR